MSVSAREAIIEATGGHRQPHFDGHTWPPSTQRIVIISRGDHRYGTEVPVECASTALECALVVYKTAQAITDAAVLHRRRSV